MIICDRCNREISENAYVCDFCGKVTIAGKKMGLGPKDYSILLGIFGLLISLFIPLITWGLAGVGYKQAKENSNNKGLAINTVAIIISIISMIYYLYQYFKR